LYLSTNPLQHLLWLWILV